MQYRSGACPRPPIILNIGLYGAPRGPVSWLVPLTGSSRPFSCICVLTSISVTISNLISDAPELICQPCPIYKDSRIGPGCPSPAPDGFSGICRGVQ